MNEENQVYFVDSDKLPEEALKRKHRLEQDPYVPHKPYGIYGRNGSDPV